MLTPSVFAALTRRPEPDPPVRCCIIWRRAELANGARSWDFFCRAPLSDAERIVDHDCREMGLENEDYQVWRG
jgi:hypothetical protein